MRMKEKEISRRLVDDHCIICGCSYPVPHLFRDYTDCGNGDYIDKEGWLMRDHTANCQVIFCPQCAKIASKITSRD